MQNVICYHFGVANNFYWPLFIRTNLYIMLLTIIFQAFIHFVHQTVHIPRVRVFLCRYSVNIHYEASVEGKWQLFFFSLLAAAEATAASPSVAGAASVEVVAIS